MEFTITLEAVIVGIITGILGTMLLTVFLYAQWEKEKYGKGDTK